MIDVGILWFGVGAVLSLIYGIYYYNKFNLFNVRALGHVILLFLGGFVSTVFIVFFIHDIIYGYFESNSDKILFRKRSSTNEEIERLKKLKD